MEKKKWWTSKTIWTNAVAILAVVLQEVLGLDVLGSATQVAILGMINLILRIITKGPVGW